MIYYLLLKFEAQEDGRCGWRATISEDQSIFASYILLPVSYQSLQNSGGNLQLLFLDGTSGLVNEPYVNIIWMHMFGF